MPDTCPVCGRYYAMYSEGHRPNGSACLKLQFDDLKERVRRLEVPRERGVEFVELLQWCRDGKPSDDCNCYGCDLRKRAKALKPEVAESSEGRAPS